MRGTGGFFHVDWRCHPYPTADSRSDGTGPVVQVLMLVIPNKPLKIPSGYD